MDLKSTSKKPACLYNDIIFDMDGVLIDSIELWIDIGLQGLREQNINATRDQMIKGIVKFSSLEKLGIPDMHAFGERINTLFCERIYDATLQKNIVSVLAELTAAQKRLAVATTSGRVAVDGILKNLGIYDYFDTIITFDDVKNHKPDPEGLLQIMKKHNAKAEETLIIGDTRNDILAGQAAGISTVLYYPDLHGEIYDRDHLLALNADYYIKDLSELTKIVL